MESEREREKGKTKITLSFLLFIRRVLFPLLEFLRHNNNYSSPFVFTLLWGFNSFNFSFFIFSLPSHEFNYFFPILFYHSPTLHSVYCFSLDFILCFLCFYLKLNKYYKKRDLPSNSLSSSHLLLRWFLLSFKIYYNSKQMDCSLFFFFSLLISPLLHPQTQYKYFFSCKILNIFYFTILKLFILLLLPSRFLISFYWIYSLLCFLEVHCFVVTFVLPWLYYYKCYFYQ